MDKRVSIIIPVYKAEKYVHEAIDSVIEQDYVQKELLLIDDGSPDSSGEICDDYASRYDWIKAIHIPNGGVGNARNTGVESATGEYVLFIDADDRLDGADVITKLVKCAAKQNADIVCGSFRIFTEQNVSRTNYHHLSSPEEVKDVDFRFRGYFQYGHLGFVWGKLYRKQFLCDHSLSMGKYVFLEDKLFNMQCTACRPRYDFVEESVYLYRTNEESVSFKYKEDFIDVWTGAAKEFHDFLMKRKMSEQYRDMICFHIFLGVFSLAKQETFFQKNKVTSVWKALKAYASDEFCRSCFRDFAKGRYLNKISSTAWKIVIRVVSVFVWMRAYYLLALGMTILIGSKIDQKIIGRKYNG